MSQVKSFQVSRLSTAKYGQEYGKVRIPPPGPEDGEEAEEAED